MHRIVLNVKDNALNNLLKVLNKLPDESVEIINNETITSDKKEDFDFSNVKIKAFKDIDPLAWQKSIRDEWESGRKLTSHQL